MMTISNQKQDSAAALMFISWPQDLHLNCSPRISPEAGTGPLFPAPAARLKGVEC